MALAAFASTILRLATDTVQSVRRPTMLFAASLLAAVRVADQAMANPVADVVPGTRGHFGVHVAGGLISVGIRGRESGCGLAAGDGSGRCRESGISDGRRAVCIFFRRDGDYLDIGSRSAGPSPTPGSGSRVCRRSFFIFVGQSMGIPVGLLLFMLVTGNFRSGLRHRRDSTGRPRPRWLPRGPFSDSAGPRCRTPDDGRLFRL